MRIELVAKRSGVHRSSIYRRWGSPAGIVADLADDITRGLAIKQTGSLEGDLAGIADQVAKSLTPEGAALVRSLLAWPDDAVREVLAGFWLQRREAVGVVLGRHGHDVDPAVVLRLLAGPLHFQAVIEGRRIEPGTVRAAVDAASQFARSAGGPRLATDDYHAGLVLRPMAYRYLARPRVDRGDPHAEGVNCRSLVQDWFEGHRGLFLSRDQVEQPGLWDSTGHFLPVGVGDRTALEQLPDECVLLCERITDASGRALDRSPEAFATAEDYRMHLHAAVLLHTATAELVPSAIPRDGAGLDDKAVLHATAVAGQTCVWGLEKLLQHYRVVAAKRVA